MTTWRLHTKADVDVPVGPALLSGLAEGPSLAAHAERYGPVPELRVRDVVALGASLDVRGRGGAGFSFSRKLETVAARRGRPYVVVNLSEGEPASFKDGVLAVVAPHLVLDGALVSAQALGAKEVHLVLPSESPDVSRAVRRALVERAESGSRRQKGRDGQVAWVLHDAEECFVAGQSSAVIELLSGRANLPVTSWQPTAHSGFRGRPTLLSNAETFAHVGRLALAGLADARRFGTREEPGTTLMTLDGDSSTRTASVVEVEFGTPWSDLLSPSRIDVPVLLGGYHGTWAGPGALRHLTISRPALADQGLSLGAGIVLPLEHGCPLDRTSQIVTYLAAQSARRCGPCFNGLPALASALSTVRAGGDTGEVERLMAMIHGRGACAHPDGTVRLVASLISAFGCELALHSQQQCGFLPSKRIRLGVSA